jgi:hypothetical protein
MTESYAERKAREAREAQQRRAEDARVRAQRDVDYENNLAAARQKREARQAQERLSKQRIAERAEARRRTGAGRNTNKPLSDADYKRVQREIKAQARRNARETAT